MKLASHIINRIGVRRLACLLLAGLVNLAAPAAASDFDVDGPTVELRRIQFCEKCQAALVVTTIPAGARIVCPKCNALQNRIPSRYLLVKLYQVCPQCGARLEVSKYAPGQLIRCGNCRHCQRVLEEAIFVPSEVDGDGTLPEAERVAPIFVPGGNDGRKISRGPELPPAGQENLALPQPAGCSVFVAPPGVPEERRVFGDDGAERDVAAGEPILPPTAEDYGLVYPSAPAGGAAEAGGLAGGVAALVDGREITEAELSATVEQILSEAKASMGRFAFTGKGRAMLESRRPQVRAQALEMLIDRRLVLAEAAARGARPGAAEIERRAAALRGQRPGAALSALTDEAEAELALEQLLECRPAAAAGDAKKFYDENSELFMRPERVAVSAIVIFDRREGRGDPRAPEAIAAEAYAQLAAGCDFARTARIYDESSFRDAGGALSAGGQRLLPLALLSSGATGALAQLRPGEYSRPFRGAGCVVIVKLEERLAAAPAPFAEAREQAENLLRARENETRAREMLRSLRDNAEIRRR